MDMIFTLLAVAIAGFCLGLFFFGSLWITVRQLPTTQWPLRLVVGSYLGRIVIACLGIFLLMNGDWPRAIAALAGFLMARMVLVTQFSRGVAAGK
jgi:F1F0 ATPase subunit 2